MKHSKHTDLISSIQFAGIIASTIIGVTLLVLPRIIVTEVGEAAIIVSITGLMISFISLMALILLGKKYPNHTIMGCNRMLLGKFIGTFFNCLIVILAIIIMSFEVREFAEVLANGLLPNTPIEISIILMIIVCALAGFHNVSTFAYIHFFYLPFILIPMILFFLAFEDIKVYHFLPILGHNLSFKEFMHGALNMASAITNFYVIAMLSPYIKDYNKSLKHGIWGFFLGGVTIIYTIVVSLGVFGVVELHKIYWPVLSLSRIIEIPGEVLSRVDAIVLINWIFAVFTTLLSYYFVIVRGTAEIFRTDKYHFIATLMVPVVFIVALVPNNIYEIYRYGIKVAGFAMILYIILPISLLIIGRFRKKVGMQ
ncbi:GerAB/ArcD/ProY family transporter [Ureibacillus thermophilus]|uniref:Spore gernimation protein n=1 Tax=Ureibacillus thermophilus TaxID=367743 RepID=A0A4P6URN9_9BACL|nr:endospore germination permease [Ureibacillus thermophilus]QBK25919.1 spore gernimation protein [Ureibacillus thermophilus]